MENASNMNTIHNKPFNWTLQNQQRPITTQIKCVDFVHCRLVDNMVWKYMLDDKAKWKQTLLERAVMHTRWMYGRHLVAIDGQCPSSYLLHGPRDAETWTRHLQMATQQNAVLAHRSWHHLGTLHWTLQLTTYFNGDVNVALTGGNGDEILFFFFFYFGLSFN